MFRYRFFVRIITAGLIVALFLLVGFAGTGTALTRPIIEAYNRTNLIRLHVVANSDSPLDQAIKLKVRDRIIEVMEPLLLRVEDSQKAEQILQNHLDLLKETARRELRRNHRPMPVQISFGRFSFPERIYPFGTLPSGDYKGVRIVLGKGLGKNWWCVLYPPLCLLEPDAPSSQSVTKQNGNQQNVNRKKPVKIQYRLATLERLLQKKGLAMNGFWQGWGRYFGLL